MVLAYSSPGNCRSAMYCAWPVTLPTPSLRGGLEPTEGLRRDFTEKLGRDAYEPRAPDRLLCRRCADALEDELLRSIAGIDLGHVQVALRVDRRPVRAAEISRGCALLAELIENLKVLSIDDDKVMVAVVGDVHVLLLG